MIHHFDKCYWPKTVTMFKWFLSRFPNINDLSIYHVCSLKTNRLLLQADVLKDFPTEQRMTSSSLQLWKSTLFFFCCFFFKATINQVWHFQFFTSSEILLASSLLKLFFPFAALWHFSVVSAQRGINSAPQGSPRMKYHCLLLHAQTGGFGLVLWPALSPRIHETGWCHGISSATRSMGCFSFCQQAPEFLRGKAL